MTAPIRLRLDALSPSIGDQLRDQGLRLSADALEIAERRRGAITGRVFAGTVSAEEARVLRQRLADWIYARVVGVSP